MTRHKGWWSGVIVLLAACAALTLPAAGQDKEKPKEEKKAEENKPIPVEKLETLKFNLPAAAVDPEFAAYVHPVLLGTAWREKDLLLLVELAEGLAVGEAKLGRPHKGIKTADLFMGAARLAVIERDTAAIDRLKTAALKAKHKDLADELAQVRKLAAAPRAAAPSLMVNVNDLTPEGLKSYRQALTDIEKAKAAGDVEELDRLAKLAKDADGWADKMRQQAQEQIAKARESAKDADDSTKLLGKLAGSTRTAGTVAILTNGATVTIPAGSSANLPVGTTVVGPVVNSYPAGTVAITITAGPPNALSKTPNSFIATCPGLPAAFVCNGRSIWMDNPALFMFTNRTVVVNSATFNSYNFIGNCRRGQKIVTSVDRGPAPWYLVTSNFNGQDMSAIPFDNGVFASANGSSLQVIPSASIGRIPQPGFALISLR